MSDELEIAAAASVGALVQSAPVAQVDDAALQKVCSNCDAPLQGQYCEVCGQLASDFHRPIWGLTKDILSDAVSLDGRIARTLPSLMFAPGKVTRAYLEGKRARYVPPFRLFLLASLVFFFTLFAVGDRIGWADEFYVVPKPDGGYEITLGGSLEVLGGEEAGTVSALTPDQLRALLEVQADTIESNGSGNREFVNLALKAFENQRAIARGIERWAPRLSLLILPLMVAFLTLVYLWYRRIYVYDHVITSLHFQSFAYILGALTMFAGLLVGGNAAWALLALPIYLYRQMRVTYRGGIIASGIRVLTLIVLLAASLAAVAVGAFVLGFLDL